MTTFLLPSRFRSPRLTLATAGLLLSASLAACSPQSSTDASGAASASGPASASGAAGTGSAGITSASDATTSGAASGNSAGNGGTGDTLRLGLFPNVTHAAALVGVDEGLFEKNLGNTALSVSHFTNGAQVTEAFAAGALDAAYLGPGPAMNAFLQGVPVKIYAGAANGGAVLVARSDTPAQSVKDLAGKSVAVPTRGSTQDISLRHLLHENGLKTADEGGDVTVVPISPADMPAAFASKQVDAALVQEPWGTILENQGAQLLVDEKGIWAGGDYTTTVLMVNTKYAEEHPQALAGLLQGHRQAAALVKDQPDEARAAISRQIAEITGKQPTDEELQKALDRTQVTWDINLDTLAEYAALNQEAGFSRRVPDLGELVDLSVVRSLKD